MLLLHVLTDCSLNGSLRSIAGRTRICMCARDRPCVAIDDRFARNRACILDVVTVQLRRAKDANLKCQ